MTWNKIKIRKPDTLFRTYLLKLRGEKCEKCGQIGRVEVSHFYGRRNENTRYSEANTDLLCSGDHRLFHERPQEYSEWKLKKLGKKEFAKLKLAANLYCKRDDKLQVIALKKLLELSTL